MIHNLKISIKNFRKKMQSPVIVGTLAYYISKILVSTLSIKVITSKKYNKEEQYLFAFWHGKQFLPVMMLQNHTAKKAALVSPSRDGSILEQWLKKIGYDVERGSSRDKNVASLVRMIKRLKSGYTLGFGIDGPVGPIYKVKPGMTYMAQKCCIPIIPLASSYAKKWVFNKAWDKYELPKPFTKAVYYIGDPVFVSKDDDLDNVNANLEAELNRLQQLASSEL